MKFNQDNKIAKSKYNNHSKIYGKLEYKKLKYFGSTAATSNWAVRAFEAYEMVNYIKKFLSIKLATVMQKSKI